MLNLTDSQQVNLKVAFADKAGNAAAVDGAPVWTSSDETVLTVAAATDGLSAVATATGKLGTAQVSVSADADLGSGTTTLTGTLDVTVLAGSAVSAVVSADAPTDKP